jgi:hypothetical protein
MPPQAYPYQGPGAPPPSQAQYYAPGPQSYGYAYPSAEEAQRAESKARKQVSCVLCAGGERQESNGLVAEEVLEDLHFLSDLLVARIIELRTFYLYVCVTMDCWMEVYKCGVPSPILDVFVYI